MRALVSGSPKMQCGMCSLILNVCGPRHRTVWSLVAGLDREKDFLLYPLSSPSYFL